MSTMLKAIFSASVVISALYAASATTVTAQHILPFPGADATAGPYLPGYGSLPIDETILETIVDGCRGQPGCIALAWGSVAVGRCRNGIGVPDGCVEPNGEGMKGVRSAINLLPPNLHPDAILKKIESDPHGGPGRNNAWAHWGTTK
jgi:hypothetical protein